MLCWFFGAVFFSMLPPSHVPSPLPFMIVPMFFLAWIAPWIAMIVMGIVYGIRANQGEWAEYPVLGRVARRILHIGPGGERDGGGR